jgi:amino acid transporter
MGPAIAVAYDFGPSIPYAGITLPLSSLLAMVIVLCTANSVGQLGRVYADAGGLYAYVAKALGRRIGFLTGWINLFFQPFFAVLLYLMIAAMLQGTFQDKFGGSPPISLFIVLAAIVVFTMTTLGVRTATNAGVYLGAFEIIVFFALSVWVIVASGSTNTLHAFNPADSAQSGIVGTAKGAIYAILAFVGFEGAAVLGEESRDPHRLIPRGVMLAALIVGIFFCVTAYASVIGWGPSHISSYAANSNPWLVIATKFWGLGWIAILIALLNSGIANATAGVNSCSRVLFSMGRAGLMPKILGKVHPRFRTPYVAIGANTVFALVIALLAGAEWGALEGFAVTATAFVVLVIVWYMLANVACFVEYVRRRRHEMSVFKHIVVPALGLLTLTLPMYFTYVPLSPYPVNIALIVAPAWIVVGIVLLVVLELRASPVLDRTQRVFSEKLDTATPASPEQLSGA